MISIDIQLIEDKEVDKLFTITNDDGTIYDMTGSTAECKLYLDPESPTTIACTIDVGTGVITVPFTTTHTANVGTFEYIIEETNAGGTVISVAQGQIVIVSYTPFSEAIEAYLNSELPANLVLTEEYRNQRIMYWRRTFQSAFDITDNDLNIEEAWPVLVNALLAKLVVYDALILAAKGSFIQFMGGSHQSTTSTTGGGALKSVETGPAKVEYYDSAASAKSAFSTSAGGMSFFESLLSGICGLANQLGVKVHMCSGNTIPIKPQYHQNSDWDYTTLAEQTSALRQPSQG